jgi:hypothetical protein
VEQAHERLHLSAAQLRSALREQVKVAQTLHDRVDIVLDRVVELQRLDQVRPVEKKAKPEYTAPTSLGGWVE